MKKSLACRACDARLTAPLTILSGKDPSVTAPEFRDREPFTEPGTVFKSYEPLVRSFRNEPAPLEFVPQVWINPDDLTDVVRLTKNRRRLRGCCGISGLNGPNQLCACGAEIGTLQTDCFTPLVFVAEPDATDWIEEP
jgi:hypothetical protein